MPEPELTPGMYGPDITFAGVPRTTLHALAGGGFDVVFIGAPFDGGTSHRPGTRFGPQAIRGTDYLPHDASRPHLALGVDPLRELRVADLGDVVMPSGEMERSLRGLESVVQAVAAAGAVPVILGGDHTITFPDATGRGQASRLGARVADSLRRARGHRGHAMGVDSTGTARRCGG